MGGALGLEFFTCAKAAGLEVPEEAEKIVMRIVTHQAVSESQAEFLVATCMRIAAGDHLRLTRRALMEAVNTYRRQRVEQAAQREGPKADGVAMDLADVFRQQGVSNASRSYATCKMGRQPWSR